MGAHHRVARAQDRLRVERRALNARAFFEARTAATNASHAHGRQLRAHLEGTRAIAEAWQQPRTIVDAALFHSIYGTDVYPHRSLARSERAEVRAVVGTESERLVYLFATIDRREFRSRLQAAGGDRRPLHVAFHDGSEIATIAPHETFALLVLYMANECEQTCAADGSPARLYATLAAIGRHLDPRDGTLPPIVRGAPAAMTIAEDDALIAAYASGVDPIALCERYPFVAEVAVAAAAAELEGGRTERAFALLDRAESGARLLGAPWDKRRSAAGWSQRIAHVRSQAERRT